jgi:hypothetical protein
MFIITSYNVIMEKKANPKSKTVLAHVAGSLGAVALTALPVLPYLAHQNRRVEKQFKENIRSSGVTPQSLIAASPDQKRNITLTPETASKLAMGSMLVYQCRDKIAKKAEHIQNRNGEKYLEDDGSKTRVWDAAAEEYIELDNLYQAQHEDGLQVASYYNQRTNDVVWAFGGTDFSNARDLLAGGQVIAGGLAPRVLSADRAVDRTLQALRDKFGSVDPKSVKHTAFMHSTGVQTYAASVVRFAQDGLKFDEAYNIDGFGAQKAFLTVAETVGDGTPQETMRIFREATAGIVAVGSDNEVERLLMPLKNTDPLNLVGGKARADQEVGGTVIDAGTTGHQAFNYTNYFSKKASNRI